MAVTKLDITRQGQFSGNTNIGFKLTGVTDPTLAQDAATKAYVDSLAVNGADWKFSVRAGTTTAGTLASSFAAASVIDGVTLATGDRILIKDQSTASENGLYVVAASGTPTRSTDADTNTKFTANTSVFVEEGTVNADQGYTLTNNGPVTLGTTGLTFTQFTGLGQITPGNVLAKAGNTISVAAMATGTAIIGNAGTPTVTAITGDVTIGATGVTAIGANKVTLAQQATLAANSVIGNSTGSAATPTAVAMVSTATASAVAIRDTNANTRVNNLIESLTTTATAAATTTLTVASTYNQQFTGTTTQTVVLPDATTLVPGQAYAIFNRSTASVTVNANGGGLIQTMAANSQTVVTAVTTGVAAGTWDSAYSAVAGGVGTVTTVSVATANGFAGTVATASSTPVITVSTSITGLLKGNGTAVSAAVAGTDYLVTTNFVDKEIPTGLINSSNTTYTLANTPVAGSEHVYLNGILQESGAGNDYTIATATITYLTAPVTGDKIRVTYRK